MNSTPLILDSNFFIIGFKDDPDSLSEFISICEKHGYQLYTSLKVFQELDWRLRKRLLNRIRVLNIEKKEVDIFINANKEKLSLPPQRPDITLLILLNQLSNGLLVSSDLHLVQTVNLINNNSAALMGSAFLLKMIEEEHEGQLKYFLWQLREKIYNEEIRYSIHRKAFYDPVTRIKLIEQQSLDIIKNMSLSTSETYEWSTSEVNQLIELLNILKTDYPKFIQEINEGRYEALINSFNNIRKEIYNTLLLLNWQVEREESERLMRIVAPNLALLNYLTAICYVYMGGRDNLYNAFRRLESASGIIMLSPIPSKIYRELMISIHQFRMIVLILLKRYDEAVFYFSLFERKCDEWGFHKQFEVSKGIYYALINLNGGQLIEKISDVKYIKPVLRFLIDLAHQLFILNQVNEIKIILNQAFIFNMELKDENYFREIVNLALLLYYSTDRTDILLDLIKFAEGARSTLASINKSTMDFENILSEIKYRKIPLIPELSGKNIPMNNLPAPLLEWMTVYKIQDLSPKEDKILVFCRNWKLGLNILLNIFKDKLPRPINQGDGVKLGEGYYKILKSKKQINQRFNISLEITPERNNSKLYIQGSQGFKCVDLCDNSLLELTSPVEHKGITGILKSKLHL
ncbi:MAG: hypothetical protein OdinLCB4_002060 [Candidatus Odinarchaeum yellowstonii]|uniref:PIN domain-containing protein n=1 Tax=Odinarchaeota yellowstonii (strain LCB_4) TaxID=1841599 RepID=A0AAF0D2Z3_ODILC|nr:MAG: hypothetical protein OdinLCB4_002060 [Candidatus Odinarchaeum yellowstonii]